MLQRLVLCFSLACHAAQAQVPAPTTRLDESVTLIDVKVSNLYGREETGKVVITEFRPRGHGPFPLVVINHGRTSGDRGEVKRFRLTAEARFFMERGYTVFVPTRIGYGEQGTEFDPENSGACKNKKFAPGADASSTELLAVLDYARRQDHINTKQILLVGQSYGGYAILATAARNPAGVVAGINFAGGSGGQPEVNPGIPCQGFLLEEMFTRFGSTSTVPMLWIYTENDQYFSPVYSQAWHQAYVRAGGNAEFHLLPPFSDNGHHLFSRGREIWSPIVDKFLLEHALMRAVPRDQTFPR